MVKISFDSSECVFKLRSEGLEVDQDFHFGLISVWYLGVLLISFKNLNALRNYFFHGVETGVVDHIRLRSLKKIYYPEGGEF